MQNKFSIFFCFALSPEKKSFFPSALLCFACSSSEVRDFPSNFFPRPSVGSARACCREPKKKCKQRSAFVMAHCLFFTPISPLEFSPQRQPQRALNKFIEAIFTGNGKSVSVAASSLSVVSREVSANIVPSRATLRHSRTSHERKFSFGKSCGGKFCGHFEMTFMSSSNNTMRANLSIVS